MFRTEVVGVEKGSVQLTVRASASGQKRSFEADLVVHAGGRVPEIDDLDLNVAGVEWNERGVKVNEFLQSVSNPLCTLRAMSLQAKARLSLL